MTTPVGCTFNCEHDLLTQEELQATFDIFACSAAVNRLCRASLIGCTHCVYELLHAGVGVPPSLLVTLRRMRSNMYKYVQEHGDHLLAWDDIYIALRDRYIRVSYATLEGFAESDWPLELRQLGVQLARAVLVHDHVQLGYLLRVCGARVSTRLLQAVEDAGLACEHCARDLHLAFVQGNPDARMDQ
jgi:hypothetical protein